MDYNYPPEEEAVKGFKMLKEFETIYHQWRIKEKNLVLDVKNVEASVSRNVMGVVSAYNAEKFGLKKITLVDKQCQPLM